MTSHVNVLKIQVPAERPVPLLAAKIGEVFARFLVNSSRLLASAARAVRPRAIRAELLDSASGVESQRPATALSLRSVAARGWIY